MNNIDHRSRENTKLRCQFIQEVDTGATANRVQVPADSDTVYAALVFVYRQLTWVLYTGIEFTYNYIIKRQGFPYGYFVRHPEGREHRDGYGDRTQARCEGGREGSRGGASLRLHAQER